VSTEFMRTENVLLSSRIAQRVTTENGETNSR
jgi:hypothetical protein